MFTRLLGPVAHWMTGWPCGPPLVGTRWHSLQANGLEMREPSVATVETWRRWAPTLAPAMALVESTGGAQEACVLVSPRAALPWQPVHPLAST